MAKTKKAGPIYQLKLTLRDIKPPVWRRMQVEHCSLSELHDIIQTCMGWDGYHLHAFEIGGEQYSEPDAGRDYSLTDVHGEVIKEILE